MPSALPSRALLVFILTSGVVLWTVHLDLFTKIVLMTSISVIEGINSVEYVLISLYC